MAATAAAEAGGGLPSFLDGSCECCGRSRLEGCSCLPFLVTPSGYTRAGEGQTVPLFGFHVTDVSGRSFAICRTIEDFDELHARLGSHGRHEDTQLPKLPGKKMINANTHAHLRKRVRRYAEYLNSVLTLRWAKDTPIVAAFLTDESKQKGILAADCIEGDSHLLHAGLVTETGCGGVEWEYEGEAARQREEIERLRKRVEELEGGHRAWSNTLQHLLVVTLFHPRREEDHRVRLEKLLKRAVAENASGKVSDVECTSVRTPKTSHGIPHFSLQTADGPKSTWGLRLDKGHYSCDLRLRGRKLGVAFECHVTLTMGLLGQIHLSILGGDAPSASVRFTSEPQIEVQTSVTRVTWGSLTVPLQEQVSTEIELHALGLLKNKLNPPSVMSFPLGEAEVLFDGDDTVHVAQAAPALSRTSFPGATAASGWEQDRKDGRVEVADESIGLSFVSVGKGLPFAVSSIHRGGAAERTCSLRVGDVLVAVGADDVLSAHPQVLRALLMWPPECSRCSRLVQLTMRRDKQPVHVSLRQSQPAGWTGSRGSSTGGGSLVNRVDNVVGVFTREEGGPQGGLPSGWEAGVRHEEVAIAPLGLLLEISALDGRTRIKGFFEGGPAERTEQLVEGDEVCEVNGLSIPVGISPACARLTRILESEGSGGRNIPLCVKRTSAWGMQQTVKVQVKIEPPSDGDDWDVVSTSSEDSTVQAGNRAHDRRRPLTTKARSGANPVVRGSQRPMMLAGGVGAGMGMSGPQMLFKELTGLVSDALEATMPH